MFESFPVMWPAWEPGVLQFETAIHLMETILQTLRIHSLIMTLLITTSLIRVCTKLTSKKLAQQIGQGPVELPLNTD